MVGIRIRVGTIGQLARTERDADGHDDFIDVDGVVGVTVAYALRHERFARRALADIRAVEVISQRLAGGASGRSALAGERALERTPTLHALVRMRAELVQLGVERQLE